MSGACDSGTHDAVPSITAEQIAAKLKQAGHAVPGNTFADEDGVAWFIGRTPRTLARWRDEAKGPPARQLSGWLYPLDEFAAWIRAQPHAGSGHSQTSDDR